MGKISGAIVLLGAAILGSTGALLSSAGKGFGVMIAFAGAGLFFIMGVFLISQEDKR